jgi:hypothetical protein
MTSDFIWHMEDVLNLYEHPYDPKRPVSCFDERPCKLIGDAIIPIPINPGSPYTEHYEYIQNGTCCIFLAFEPRSGKRIVCVKERRTKVDCADFMKTFVHCYPDAETILLVQDSLNTHTSVSFHGALSAEEAFELAKRFEFHYTILPRKEVCLIWLRSNSQHFQSNAWIAGLNV